MAELEYSLHVAPSKPVVSDDLPPGESQRMWSPTTSTLIRGERDAVLVDPLLTIDESRALADWVGPPASTSPRSSSRTRTVTTSSAPPPSSARKSPCP